MMEAVVWHVFINNYVTHSAPGWPRAHPTW